MRYLIPLALLLTNAITGVVTYHRTIDMCIERVSRWQGGRLDGSGSDIVELTVHSATSDLARQKWGAK